MSPETVAKLVDAIERKDLSTAAHTWRVVLYTRAMLEENGFDHETIELVTQAAALHDIGKLDIPTSILQKPGKLTDVEFEVIKQHPVTGYARLISLDVEEPAILNLVRYHHERWDGKGYPYGLKGGMIPVGARLFAVIDTFDALTSIRPYRQEIGEDAAHKAIEILEEGAGTQYDKDAVEVFTSLFKTGKLDYILHYFNDLKTVPDFCVTTVDLHRTQFRV